MKIEAIKIIKRISINSDTKNKLEVLTRITGLKEKDIIIMAINKMYEKRYTKHK